ncbi:MAG: hypothetical protein QM604_02290 [Microbacterium sp.]
MTDAVCSRAGCRAPARWRIDWRNPRIHDASRRKTWVACDEHLPFLRDYLTSRGLPAEVAILEESAAR